MKKIILTLTALLFFTQAHAADETEHSHNHDHETRLLKTIKIADGQYVYLSARNNGHVLGQKFLLETRVSCNGEAQDFTKLEVKDSYSVCNMQPESIVKNTKGTALAMLVKSANINKYYNDIGAGIASPNMSCHEGNEVLKFSIQNFCKKDLQVAGRD